MGAIGFVCGRCARVCIVHKDLCTSTLRALGCVRDGICAPPSISPPSCIHSEDRVLSWFIQPISRQLGGQVKTLG